MSERLPAERPPLMRAILTDIQFWVPTLVLGGGILMLIFLRET